MEKEEVGGLTLELIEKREEFVNLSKNATAAIEYAEGLEINTELQQTKAIDAVTKIKNEGKRGDTIRRFFTDPLNAQVKKINELFMPNLKAFEKAEGLIKTAMVKYQEKIAVKADIAKEKAAKQIESGKISIEEGVKKIENVKTPEKTVRTEAATVSYKIEKVVTIVDPALLPRDYLMPDVKKIEAVAKAGVEIPGVKVTETKSPIIRAK